MIACRVFRFRVFAESRIVIEHFVSKASFISSRREVVSFLKTQAGAHAVLLSKQRMLAIVRSLIVLTCTIVFPRFYTESDKTVSRTHKLNEHRWEVG